MPTVQVVMTGAPLGNTDLYHSLSNVFVGEASITTEVPLPYHTNDATDRQPVQILIPDGRRYCWKPMSSM